MSMDREEMLKLADKIAFAVKTEGKVTLFQEHGALAEAALRAALAQCDAQTIPSTKLDGATK